MANSVDPDQTPRSTASDLGLHCLQRPILSVPIQSNFNGSHIFWTMENCSKDGLFIAPGQEATRDSLGIFFFLFGLLQNSGILSVLIK